ncbi:MAG: hypothetical protein LBV58_04975 [Acholeplasmatales bacterium]|jgi:hypothetical protein|nr:hypothetical protein [Acholeplasmatales bacterium]
MAKNTFRPYRYSHFKSYSINILIFYLTNTITFFGILGLFNLLGFEFLESSFLSLFVLELFFFIVDYFVRALLYRYFRKLINHTFGLILVVSGTICFFLSTIITPFLEINDYRLAIGFIVLVIIVRFLINIGTEKFLVFFHKKRLEIIDKRVKKQTIKLKNENLKKLEVKKDVLKVEPKEIKESEPKPTQSVPLENIKEEKKNILKLEENSDTNGEPGR